MNDCLLMAYVRKMPSIRAEQTINAAQVSAYPHLKLSDAKAWIQSLLKQVNRTLHEPGFTFNGKEVSVRGLKRELRKLLGGGFEG